MSVAQSALAELMLKARKLGQGPTMCDRMKVQMMRPQGSRNKVWSKEEERGAVAVIRGCTLGALRNHTFLQLRKKI